MWRTGKSKFLSSSKLSSDPRYKAILGKMGLENLNGRQAYNHDRGETPVPIPGSESSRRTALALKDREGLLKACEAPLPEVSVCEVGREILFQPPFEKRRDDPHAPQIDTVTDPGPDIEFRTGL